ncbi:Hsp33 family molecular chaperone HslO [Glaciecola petra]|uniref:33 kDa chaperonin n=1 Tax=Glaciecola petra TaxID=3075602 RepID=A0ABU2ZSB9_9ALTE|nr:Hsp33 family molecular chaperone HslO [Aestuariibacter sp. P117]MDT0595209.1 Hsp33 family molecular chaperone HslO [Aestuariibacter sp. P117]
MTDTLNRFLFANRPIRGELVTLEKSFQETLRGTEYPVAVQKLLGELMAATSLLCATLKFEGEIGLQIQSEGLIKYAVITGTHEQKLRGVARWDESVNEFPDTFSQWFEKGYLAITLSPLKGQRYQGVVALDKENLAECLEDYFLQSEQLLTKVMLFADVTDQAKAGGMLLQIVPTTSETSNVVKTPDFEHVSIMAETLSQQEVLNLPHQDIVKRLYHEDDIRMFEPQIVIFHCDCSKERSANALKNVSKEELLSIIEQDGEIQMDCQFCLAKYSFDKIDVENIHGQNFDVGQA